MSNNFKKYIKKAVPIIFRIGLYFLISESLNKELIFPKINSIILKFFNLVHDKSFWIEIVHSVLFILFGFMISLFFSVIFMITTLKRNYFYELINPVLNLIKSTPIAAITLVLLMRFDSNNLSVVLVIFVCLPLFYENLLNSYYNIDKKYFEMAKIFDMERKNIIKYIIIPEVIKSFVVNLNYSMAMSFKASISGEILANSKDTIGSAIYSTKIYLETETLFCYITVIFLISNILQLIIRKLGDIIET